jgi:hypothetical protein
MVNDSIAPKQAVGHLAVQPHRVDQARHPDDPRVGGDEEDRRRQQADVDLAWLLQEAQVQGLDHAEDRVAGEAALVLGDAEQRRIGAVGGLLHRQRRERDHRQQGVDGEDRDDHPVDRGRDRLRLVLGLLGHVRDRLDAGVGDHPHRDGEEEVLPRRGDPEVDVVDQRARREDEHEADHHEQQLGEEVDHGQQYVDAGRLLDAHHVDQAEDDDDADAEEDVRRAVAQRVDADDAAEVVRHEERRDGDRDRVVEHLRPGGKEGRELVEGAARERGRAARLRVHRRGLGVGGGRQIEDEAGDDEDDRRQAQRERRHEAQRVIDRRPDVAVGRREEGVDPQHPLEAVQSAFGHAARRV